jgi:hypothetical protein
LNKRSGKERKEREERKNKKFDVNIRKEYRPKEKKNRSEEENDEIKEICEQKDK